MRIFRYMLLAASFFLASCEKEKSGLIDPDLTAPFLASAELSRSSVNLSGDVAVQKLDSTTFRVTLQLAGTALHTGGGEIPHGTVEIFKPGENSPFVRAAFSLTRGAADTLTFASPLSFLVSATDVGLLRFEFTLVTSAGRQSNLLQRSLLVMRGINHPPAILSLGVPDTVTLPPGDSLLITMTAAVSDSDGLADVNEVFFYSLNSSNPTQKFALYDDGGLNSTPPSGDLVAGDGTYTITVKLVDTPTVRKTYTFEFHAVDKEGAAAAPISKRLTVR